MKTAAVRVQHFIGGVFVRQRWILAGPPLKWLQGLRIKFPLSPHWQPLVELKHFMRAKRRSKSDRVRAAEACVEEWAVGIRF
jgi:hypothetical protein